MEIILPITLGAGRVKLLFKGLQLGIRYLQLRLALIMAVEGLEQA